MKLTTICFIVHYEAYIGCQNYVPQKGPVAHLAQSNRNVILTDGIKAMI
jgi:hypothetical protein